MLDMNSAKTLTSVAMLETLWELKRSDMLDLITPFVKFGVAHTTELNTAIDTGRVAQFVKKEFGYNEFPVSIVSKILKRYSPDYFKRKNGQYFLITSLDEEVDKLSQRKAECQARIDTVALSLMPYLEEHCKRTKNFTAEKATQCLQDFFAHYGLYVGTNPYALENISPDKYEIHYYIAQFIFENERTSSKEYSYIIDLVKGYFLSTVIYLQPENGNILTANYKGTSFYYDTPFLIRLLGYQSKQEQESALELHNLLKKQSASFYYFPQTEEEIRSILSAYQNSLLTRNSSQTLEGLDLMGYGSSSVERLKQTFQVRLASPDYGINYSPLPPFPVDENGMVRTDANIIPETELQDYIRAAVGHYKSDSLAADVTSAIAIDRLRPRVPVQNVESCNAIFVTTNTDFTNAFNNYYNKKILADTFPLVISDSDLSAIAWVKSNTFDNEIPSRQLLANAYMAMQPLPQLLEKFKTIVNQLCSEGHITEEEAFLLRSNQYVAKELNRSTMGNSDAVTENLVSEIHEHYKETLVSSVKKAHREETQMSRLQTIGDACNEAHIEASKKKKAFLKYAQLANKIIFLLVACICIVGCIRSWGSLPLTITFGAFALLSLISLADTVFSKKSRVDRWINYQANRLETWVYEKKKKEYFKLLRITEEEFAILPKIE